MTRFVYIADSHIGASEKGYHQQMPYARHLPELIEHLESWIQEHHVDFVLHGGDIVDDVSPQNLKAAGHWLDLSIPVYLCLGNHDMTHKNAAQLWLSDVPDFFPGGACEFSITHQDTIIYVMPNHWCETPYYWDGQNQIPHFKRNQLEGWQEMMSRVVGKTIILCTHHEIAAVPMQQTGFNTPYHQPPMSFVNDVMKLNPYDNNLRCVLTGHNHINTCVTLHQEAIRAVSASAFLEVPFEFKVIDVDSNSLSMRTENLLGSCGFVTQYNYNKTFVQGRLKDRAFDLTW